MYVKLAIPATVTTIASWYYIRDILRLLTSSSPSTSLLTAFSSTSSVVIDATPAGWTYVGSTLAADRPTISSSVSDFVASTTVNLWGISAPCLEGSTLKYVTFTPAHPNVPIATVGSAEINMTAAQSISSTGVATNEGLRTYHTATSAGVAATSQSTLRMLASDVMHLIATPRGISLITEGNGMHAVWETSMTDPHRFYSTAPVVVWQNTGAANSLTGRTSVNATVTPFATSSSNTQAAQYFGSCVMNITDVNTATVYGPIEPINGGSATNTNSNNWWNCTGAYQRANSIDSAGNPKYQVSPIYVQPGQYGYPTMYVTGVYNAYWTKPGLGNTGDTVTINGDYYTFFNLGVGLGFLAKTS